MRLIFTWSFDRKLTNINTVRDIVCDIGNFKSIIILYIKKYYEIFYNIFYGKYIVKYL